MGSPGGNSHPQLETYTNNMVVLQIEYSLFRQHYHFSCIFYIHKKENVYKDCTFSIFHMLHVIILLKNHVCERDQNWFHRSPFLV